MALGVGGIGEMAAITSGCPPGARAEVASRLVGTYANAFMVEPGRCFRFVENNDARGQPVACPNPVTVRGPWRDGSGKLRVVEACAKHGAEIETRRPASRVDGWRRASNAEAGRALRAAGVLPRRRR